VGKAGIRNPFKQNGYMVIVPFQGARHKVYVHRLIWEEAYGPIPDGYVVHHINGDRLDNRLENLECLSNAEHTSHHFKGRIPVEGMEAARKVNTGRKHTPEHREKLRAVRLGMKLPPHSPETRQRLSESMHQFLSTPAGAEYRQELSARSKKRFATPEGKAQIARINRLSWVARGKTYA
jgi:HNH endonuclease/NUMOD3 motif